MVNAHVLVAAGVNADGHREVFGLEICTAEDAAGWLAFRGLVARGLSGVGWSPPMPTPAWSPRSGDVLARSRAALHSQGPTNEQEALTPNSAHRLN